MVRKVILIACLTVVFSVMLWFFFPRMPGQTPLPPVPSQVERSEEMIPLVGRHSTLSLVEAMTDFYASHDRWSGRVVQTISIDTGHHAAQQERREIVFALAPGNRFYLRLGPDGGPGQMLLSDGQYIYRLDEAAKHYTRDPIPSELDVVGEIMIAVMEGMPFTDPPFRGLHETFDEVTLVSTEASESGIRLALKGERRAGMLHLAPLPVPLLIEASIERSDLLDARGVRGRYEMVHRFSDWQYGAGVSDEWFKWDPPPGVRRINVIEEMMSPPTGL